MKRRMYEYLTQNKYLDQDIQKGFWSRLDGVTEHTELLTHIMKDSKRHSRSLVVTLLDLKNAFGEVHHNLIRESLKYHHLPDIFVDLFNSIYSDCSISVSANNQWTDPIGIKKGVLQGDPCSPLLFNLCFNTLMRTLKKSNLVNLGYIWGPKHSTNECAWLQFADDAVILSKSTSDAQSLLDIFVAWCNWSGMVIRLDKCASFAMTEREGVFQQIEPALFVDQERIPSIPIGAHFIYLGKIFDFDLKNEQAKKVVKEKLLKLIKIASLLRIQVQMKLKILKTYIHSQLSFELRMYNFGSTWIEENLDMETNNRVRDWLGMPTSGCISEMLALPKHKCGLGIPSFLDVAERLWLRKRFSFKNSNQRVLRQMWSESSKDHVRMDAIASESDRISTATTILRNQQMAGKEAHFLGLKMQGESPKVIIESISRKNLTSWNNLFDRLPQFLFSICKESSATANFQRLRIFIVGRSFKARCAPCVVSTDHRRTFTFFRIVPPRRHWIVTRSDTTTSCRSLPIGSLHRNPGICSSSWTCRLRHSVRLMMCFKRASGPTWYCTTVVTIFSFWNCLCVTNPTCKKLDCTNKTNMLTFLKI